MSKEINGQSTVYEARRHLEVAMFKGADCPCCGQHVKLYRRALNHSMAAALIWIDRHYQGTEDLLHVPSYFAALPIDPRVKAALRGDYAKLRYWGLIEEVTPEDPGPTRRTSGMWRITGEGRSFVHGESRVRSHVFVFNGVRVDAVEDPELTDIDIRQALGKKFNYAELMELPASPQPTGVLGGEG